MLSLNVWMILKVFSLHCVNIICSRPLKVTMLPLGFCSVLLAGLYCNVLYKSICDQCKQTENIPQLLPEQWHIPKERVVQLPIIHRSIRVSAYGWNRRPPVAPNCRFVYWCYMINIIEGLVNYSEIWCVPVSLLTLPYVMTSLITQTWKQEVDNHFVSDRDKMSENLIWFEEF